MPDEQVIEAVATEGGNLESAPIELEAEPTPEVPQEPPVESLFLQDLSSKLPPQVAKTKLRRTANGVFVSEELLDTLIEIYQAWLQEKLTAGQGKSTEKCKRRLFGSEDPELFYLIEGKICLVGYLITQPLDLAAPSPIPAYRAGLLGTQDYLHPRDPMLGTIRGAFSRMSTQHGLVLEVPVGEKRYTAPPERISEYAAIVRHSWKLDRSFPYIKRALRYAIEPFAKALTRAQPVLRRQKLLVWEKYRTDDSVTYLQLGTLVFAISANNTVLGCYERMGRNLIDFYLRELHEGAKRIRAGSQKLFKDVIFPRKRSRYICKLKGDGGFYLLSGRALGEYLRQAPSSFALRKTLPKRYTAIDAFSEFVRLFTEAVLLDISMLPKFLHESLPKKDAKFLKAGPWLFIITDTNAISSCFEIRKPKPKSEPAEGEPSATNELPAS